jgi:hypothetical protein
VPDADLEARVLNDLKMLRKSPNGITVHTLAEALTVSRLLGAGDPYVAYTRLQHVLLDATADRTVRAAAASLGFSSDGETHLDRLEDAGAELGGLDQRQARRLSDRGLQVIAKLIATNWTVEAVPALTATVAVTPSGFQIFVATQRPFVVEMSDPEIEVWVGDDRTTVEVDWEHADDGAADNARTQRPFGVPGKSVETSVAIIWRGELWPRFVVRWIGTSDTVTSETLGNKLMLRLAPKRDS